MVCHELLIDVNVMQVIAPALSYVLFIIRFYFFKINLAMQGENQTIIQDSQCFKCPYAFRSETLTHLFPLQTSYLFMFFVPPFFCQAACCDTESTALQPTGYRSGAPAQHSFAGYWGTPLHRPTIREWEGTADGEEWLSLWGRGASPAPRR